MTPTVHGSISIQSRLLRLCRPLIVHRSAGTALVRMSAQLHRPLFGSGSARTQSGPGAIPWSKFVQKTNCWREFRLFDFLRK